MRFYFIIFLIFFSCSKRASHIADIISFNLPISIDNESVFYEISKDEPDYSKEMRPLCYSSEDCVFNNQCTDKLFRLVAKKRKYDLGKLKIDFMDEKFDKNYTFKLKPDYTPGKKPVYRNSFIQLKFPPPIHEKVVDEMVRTLKKYSRFFENFLKNRPEGPKIEFAIGDPEVPDIVIQFFPEKENDNHIIYSLTITEIVGKISKSVGKEKLVFDRKSWKLSSDKNIKGLKSVKVSKKFSTFHFIFRMVDTPFIDLDEFEIKTSFKPFFTIISEIPFDRDFADYYYDSIYYDIAHHFSGIFTLTVENHYHSFGAHPNEHDQHLNINLETKKPLLLTDLTSKNGAKYIFDRMFSYFYCEDKRLPVTSEFIDYTLKSYYFPDGLPKIEDFFPSGCSIRINSHPGRDFDSRKFSFSDIRHFLKPPFRKKFDKKCKNENSWNSDD